MAEMDGIKREPLSDSEMQDIGTIKEEPNSCGESQPNYEDRAVDIKQEGLPEPFAFVSIKEEVVSAVEEDLSGIHKTCLCLQNYDR
jgi:hypothetical protein